METNHLIIPLDNKTYLILYDLDKEYIPIYEGIQNEYLFERHNFFKDCEPGKIYHLKILAKPGSCEYSIKQAKIEDVKKPIESNFNVFVNRWRMNVSSVENNKTIVNLLTSIKEKYIIEQREEKLNQIL
jgi:hypothetical protein